MSNKPYKENKYTSILFYVATLLKKEGGVTMNLTFVPNFHRDLLT